MAEPNNNATEKQNTERKKRRLKAAPVTIRERQVAAGKPKRKFRLSKVFRPLGWPFRKIYGLSVWQSKWWKPFKATGHVTGLILWPRYFRNSFKELKRVTWPSWSKTWRLTFDVLVFSIALTLLVAAIDYGLNKLFREVLLK